MAAIATHNPTLADWVKRRDPDGTIAMIANILAQTNEILDDAVFKQANGATGHQVTVATGLPDVYWRSFNEGIKPSKGRTAQLTEGIGMLESRSEVDRALASLEDDEAAFRLSESRLRLEAMNQTMTSTMFYGNSAADPKQFMGLAARYSSLLAGNSQNVISCNDGTATALAQTSIYLVGWGDETVFCTFPKGSNAGIQQEDLGVMDVDVFNDAGAYTGKMRALVDWYCWQNGLVVKDWRYAARICNIQVSDLTGLVETQLPTATAFNIIHAMSKAVYRIPNLGLCRPAFYMNRTAHSALARMAMEKSIGALALEAGHNQFGTPRRYMSFLGVPIRRCDAILNTEAVVS